MSESPGPGGGSGCWRLSSTTTGRSISQSGEQATRAASATQHTDIDVMLPSAVHQSHSRRSGSALAESSQFDSDQWNWWRRQNWSNSSPMASPMVNEFTST